MQFIIVVGGFVGVGEVVAAEAEGDEVVHCDDEGGGA